MMRIIQFTESDELKALPILLRHSPGTVLLNRTYIVEDGAVQTIQHAGIAFTELNRDE